MELRHRVIFVLGCTGVGKSQLAIDICQFLKNAEIVSADSMQIYQKFDIGSAKVTKKEQESVPHHLIDIIKFDTVGFSVRDYIKLALPVINDIVRRGNVPVVVGGTFYYVEGLLWNSFLSDGVVDGKEKVDMNCVLSKAAEDKYTTTVKTTISHTIDQERKEIYNSIENDETPTDVLYSRLREVDPVMANRLHPHDRRKIRRSLEVQRDTGQPHSELIVQCGEVRDSPYPLSRFQPLIFYLDCEVSVLSNRLTKRVENMFETGLVEELTSLYSQLPNQEDRESNPNPSRYGILQAIGFKEIIPFLYANSNDMKRKERGFVSSVEGEDKKVSKKEKEKNQILMTCKDNLIRNTHRYARRQRQWFRNRIHPSSAPQLAGRVYSLDVTAVHSALSNVGNSDMSSLLWKTQVLDPTFQICSSFLSSSSSVQSSSNNGHFSLQPTYTMNRFMLRTDDITFPDDSCNNVNRRCCKISEWKQHHCEVCNNKLLNGEHEWLVHLSSRRHHKRKAAAAKRKVNDEKKALHCG